MTIMGRGFRLRSPRNKCFQDAVEGPCPERGPRGDGAGTMASGPRKAMGPSVARASGREGPNNKNPALGAGFLHLREIK